MTPKQKLIQEINRIIRDAYQCGFDAENVNAIDFFDGFAELEALLTTKAIGEWVPVAERLPPCRFIGDVIHNHFGEGVLRVNPKTGEHGTFFNNVCDAGTHIKTDITHWLDLDMPQEVGG